MICLATNSNQEKPRPAFKNFPVKTILKSKAAPANITANWRSYRTMIRLGAKSRVEFAGHYTVPRWGCGSSCIGFGVYGQGDGLPEDGEIRCEMRGMGHRYNGLVNPQATTIFEQTLEREDSMKIRAVLSVLLGNVIGLLLIAAGGFLTVRFAPWGRWAVDSSRLSAAELAARYGDPAALLQKGALFHLWILGPVIAIVVGVVVALVFRRADLRISTLSIVSLVVVLSAPTSLTKILAACLYIVVGWLAMKLVASLMSRSASVAAPVFLPHK